MRYLDRGALIVVLGLVAFLVYVESRGGVRAFTAERGWKRKADISVPQNAEAMGDPKPMGHYSLANDGTALFANPIAAAEGAEGTLIAPMSATQGGAIKITPAEIADPAYASRLFRDPDKGLMFVALPDDLGKTSPKPTRDDGAIPTPDKGVADVMSYYRSRLDSRAQPRAFPVSF